MPEPSPAGSAASAAKAPGNCHPAGRDTLALAAIISLGAALRLVTLGKAPLWIDEAYTVLTANKPLAGIISTQGGDTSPPLFYFLLHGWSALVGDAPFSLRLLSVLLGTLLIWVVYRVGRDLISPPVGLLGALICAISPIQIYYSQQIRMYTLLPLTATAAIYFLVRYCRERTPHTFILTTLATLLCLYTHSFALFLVPAEAVVVALSGQSIRRVKEWLLMLGLLTLGYLPWLPFFLGQLHNPGPLAWYRDFWQLWGPWGAAWRTMNSFAIGGEQPAYLGLRTMAWGGTTPALLALALALLGCLQLHRLRQAAPETVLLWLPLFLTVPLLLSALSSLVVTPNYAPGRVDQMVYPAFCLLSGAGLAHLANRWLRFALIGILLVCAAQTLQGYYQQSHARGDQELAEYLTTVAEPDTTLLTTSLTRASLTYYLQHRRSDLQLLSFPPETANHLGYQNDGALLAQPEALHREAQEMINKLHAELGPTGRFLVVMVTAPVNKPLMAALNNTKELKRARNPEEFRQSVTGLTIVVLQYQFSG